ELLRRGEAHITVGAGIAHLHAGLEAARHDAHERDAVAMLRVHVRLDLEHEARELRLLGLDGTGVRFPPHGRGREPEECFQERLDTEVRERTAEERRREVTAQEGVIVERWRGDVEQRQLLRQLRMALAAEGGDNGGVVEVERFRGGLASAVIRAALEQVYAARAPLDDAD